MPEQTVPTSTTTASTGSSSPSTGLTALGCGCAALIGIPLVAVLVLIGTLAWDNRGSSDFPRVAPEDMASRVFKRSQEAYDVMGFKRTVEPGVEDIGVSTENTLSSDLCWTSGSLGLEDKTVDGAYEMSHDWALDHVPASQAVSGLRRLDQHLKDDGWEVTAYREGGQAKSWNLYVQRDNEDERMSFTWYPDREYFTGGATMPCAYDPGWETGDTDPSDDRQTPPVLGPGQ
ncbi:hypothetical protein [Streptomyces caeruleatus]|uniref:Uncharacterized protein n=1 Tax=Streptomyces caeruleatus TaxID=661399 RepID=A0A101U0X6_9ACTN|nr:hypothetical protein [Streptomyces caeruleatus]KUO02040.1 hypothetical protein AQJ67_22925 [Streptomyces caeruleatus]